MDANCISVEISTPIVMLMMVFYHDVKTDSILTSKCHLYKMMVADGTQEAFF